MGKKYFSYKLKNIISKTSQKIFYETIKTTRETLLYISVMTETHHGSIWYVITTIHCS